MKRINATADSCECFRLVSDDSASIDALGEIRNSCPALHGVFLPDAIWPGFCDWHQRPDEVACHRSMLVLAFQRQCLARVTSPIHRYLLDSGAVPSGVRKQYLQDLRENWMLYTDPLKRHEKCKSFRRRVAELQCAEWLDTQSQAVVGLEALREGPDIDLEGSQAVKDPSGDLVSKFSSFLLMI